MDNIEYINLIKRQILTAMEGKNYSIIPDGNRTVFTLLKVYVKWRIML